MTAVALLALLGYAGKTFIPTLFSEESARSATLVVSTRPEGAAVTLDGEDTGKTTPARLEGLPANTEHTLTLELKGYNLHAESVSITEADVNAEEEIKRRVFLKKARGMLDVTSTPPGAEVYLDAKYVGETPLKLKDLPRDKNELRLVLRKDGYRDYPAVLTWNDETQLPLDVKLKQRKR